MINGKGPMTTAPFPTCSYCNEGCGDAVGCEDGVDCGFNRSIVFTSFGSITVTMLPLRYQIPSPVCHASSASIVTPVCNLITTGPVLSFPPAAVETGLELNSIRCGLLCGEGDDCGLGDGDGSTEEFVLATGAGCDSCAGNCG